MTKRATFAMGCFWKPELLYSKVPGVKHTAVGFMGGTVDEPTYEQVCSDTTGHAEVVQVEYDPDEISYDELLELFWKSHDATQVDRQGPDIGKQYRSAIFYHDDEQKELAEKSKAKQGSVATEIKEASKFFKAEEYHQKYLEKRGQNTC